MSAVDASEELMSLQEQLYEIPIQNLTQGKVQIAAVPLSTCTVPNA